MAQLKKLMLQGIRSFDPDGNHPQTIEFYSPLTLIVGQNGCGKTTIIEALKFAITSEYPPGTAKAGSFVHDPKLSTGYEVPALVKLQLMDKNGDKIIMTRRLQATQKGKVGNISTKSIEATLRRQPKNGGSVQDISGKCADVKEEMCRLMGVSEAILNNVIFCHQEDSCWPLDEGKKVKERFDAIFNTTMYMKALDRLSKKEKEMVTEIRLYDDRFKNSQVFVQELRSKQRQIETLTAQMQETMDSINKHKADAGQLDERLKQLNRLEAEYANEEAKVEFKRRAIEEGKSFIEKQTSIIKKVEDGDIEDLKNAIENFKGSKNKTERQLQMTQEGQEKLVRELRKLKEQKDEILQEEGKFEQAEKENNETKDKLKTATENINSSIRSMKNNSQDASFVSSASSFLEDDGGGDESGSRPDSSVKILSTAIRSKEHEENKCKEDFESKERELEDKIYNLRESKAGIDKEIQMKEKEIATNKIAIKNTEAQLRRIESSGEKLDELNNQLEDVEEKIDTAKSSGIILKYEKEITLLKNDIKQLREKAEQDKGELDMLKKDKDILNNIQFHSNNKTKKENDCKDILKRHKNEIECILGEFPKGKLSEPIKKKFDALTSEIRNIEAKQKLEIKQLSTKEAELNQSQKELNKKEKTVEDFKVKIDEILDGEGDEFEDVYIKSCEELEMAQKDNQHNEACQHIYKKYIAKLRNRNCCPMCRRDFRNKDETKDTILQLETEIETLKAAKPTDGARVIKAQERNTMLSGLKRTWDEVEELKKEIPELRKRVTLLKSAIDESKEAVQESNNSLDLLKVDLDMATKLKTEVHMYDEYQKEIQRTEDTITQLEKKRDPKAKECSMNLAAAEANFQFNDEQLQSKLRDKEAKESMKSRKEAELNALEKKKISLETDKLQINSDLQNRDGIETKKKELEESIKTLQTAVDSLKAKLPTMQTDMKKLARTKEEVRKEKEEKLKAIRIQAKEFERQRDLLKAMKLKLEEFEERKAEFNNKQKNFKDIKIKFNETERKMDEVAKEIEGLKEELGSCKLKYQSLTISLSIKEKEQDVEKARKELQELEKTLATTKHKGVGPEKREVITKLNDIQASINRLDGSRNEKKSTLATLRLELTSKDKPYHNAEDMHRKNLIDKVVHEKARKDVLIYKTALEHAVLNFHCKKMETINQYLKFFWKKVYKGNDIEYIQIRTENEDANKAETVKVDMSKNRRRTYNYRVVMIRRGIELDMRGRCSAGQKILAAIIIRLALAQTFSVRCGVISLDEPTTNLDKKNIDSLAETLSDLALDMKDNKTFQLIVITHDQDFIDKLLHVDPVEFYFRVTRNQNGHSRIERTSK